MFWDNKLQVANPLIIVSSLFPYLPNQDPESSTDSSSDAGMGKAALSTILRTIVRGYASWRQMNGSWSIVGCCLYLVSNINPFLDWIFSPWYTWTNLLVAGLNPAWYFPSHSFGVHLNNYSIGAINSVVDCDLFCFACAHWGVLSCSIPQWWTMKHIFQHSSSSAACPYGGTCTCITSRWISRTSLVRFFVPTSEGLYSPGILWPSKFPLAMLSRT